MTALLGGPSDTLEAILVRCNSLVLAKNPKLRMKGEVVLKDGPRSYKVATHWEILNPETGELHHHSITIKTYTKGGSGWTDDGSKCITLNDDGSTTEASRLAAFIATALQARLPTDAEDCLVVPVNQTARGMVLSAESFRRLMDLCREGKADTIGQMLDWIAADDSSTEIVDRLSALNVDGLRRINTVIGVSALKAALCELQANLDNDNEEYWQVKFSENWYILSQVFAYPVVILKDKAYVGGKGFENSGGNIVDFLARNDLTGNTVLIEIKTPVARLLGGAYRNVFSISPELSGAMLQVSNYKQSLLLEYSQLRTNSNVAFEAFDPKCLVVIGHARKELTSADKTKSFELFRNGLNAVQVITFDELFDKLENLIRLLEEGE